MPNTVIRIPANFPPVKAKGFTLSGMGTPDLRGSYGTFSFYTDDPMAARAGGGRADYSGAGAGLAGAGQVDRAG